MILIERPGDLVEGAGRRGKVVIVSRPFVAVQGGEGVAGRVERVNLLFVLQIRVAQGAVSRRLGAETSRKHVAGLRRGVVEPR